LARIHQPIRRAQSQVSETSSPQKPPPMFLRYFAVAPPFAFRAPSAAVARLSDGNFGVRRGSPNAKYFVAHGLAKLPNGRSGSFRAKCIRNFYPFFAKFFKTLLNKQQSQGRAKQVSVVHYLSQRRYLFV
jgi:hypothetical protein